MSQSKVIAITGASSGMGAATARYLAARGAQVVLGARRTDRLQALVEAIRAEGGQAKFVAMDVAEREDVERLVQTATGTYGRLDVLIGNAGVMPIGPLADLAVEDWSRMVDVNIKGVLWGIAAALPVFQSQGSGHFIHVASTAARKIVPNMAVYAGTKAAVAAISEGLRQEVAGSGLRVTTLLPGFTATEYAEHVRDPALRAQMAAAGEGLAMSPDAIAAAIHYAIEQPEAVNIGEMVIRPTAQT